MGGIASQTNGYRAGARGLRLQQVRGQLRFGPWMHAQTQKQRKETQLRLVMTRASYLCVLVLPLQTFSERGGLISVAGSEAVSCAGPS